MGWIIYMLVVVVVSGLIGTHLGRFREVYTEMLGMMVGMTMGMLNGLLSQLYSGRMFQIPRASQAKKACATIRKRRPCVLVATFRFAV